MNRYILTALSVRDTLGARLSEVKLGKKITIFSGKNASGKSTMLESLKRALLGGTDLKWLANVHVDEPDPRVLVRAEDSTGRAYSVTRIPGEVEVLRQVLGKNGKPTAAEEPVAKPVPWLRGLLPQVALDIGALLVAKGEDLATLILLACPLKLELGALLKASGLRAEELPPLPDRLHPLEVVHLIREHVDKVTRRSINRDIDGLAKTAATLLADVELPIPESRAAEIARLEVAAGELHRDYGRLVAEADAAEAKQREAAEHAQVAEDARLVAGFAGEKALAGARLASRSEACRSAARGIVADQIALMKAMRADVERDVADIWRRLESQEAEIQRKADAELAKAEAEVAKDTAASLAETETLRAAVEAQRDKAEQTLEVAREMARRERTFAENIIASTRDAQAEARTALAKLRAEEESGALKRSLRAQADKAEAEARELQAASDRLTRALAGLDAYRRSLAEKLPLPGLSIEGKDIRVGNVPWEQLNHAQRMELLVRLCVLGVGDAQLPVLFLDDAESIIDGWPDLLRALAKAPVQSFIARAEKHEFRCDAIDTEADVARYVADIE